MPPGVPVATVAIDGAANAAYLAIEILALQNFQIKERFKVFKQSEREKLESALVAQKSE